MPGATAVRRGYLHAPTSGVTKTSERRHSSGPEGHQWCPGMAADDRVKSAPLRTASRCVRLGSGCRPWLFSSPDDAKFRQVSQALAGMDSLCSDGGHGPVARSAPSNPESIRHEKPTFARRTFLTLGVAAAVAVSLVVSGCGGPASAQSPAGNAPGTPEVTELRYEGWANSVTLPELLRTSATWAA